MPISTLHLLAINAQTVQRADTTSLTEPLSSLATCAGFGWAGL